MKNLIIYASKYGTTAECAKTLAGLLKGETIVQDIAGQDQADPSSFDCIIIGSSVYMGQVNKKIKNFCEQHKSELLKKELVIFICSGIPENFGAVIEANFSAEIRNHAVDLAYFGGQLDLSKMNFMDKTIAGLMAKQKGEAQPIVKIDAAAIRELAERLNEEGNSLV
jgi:menaquinone-dependent protoporphyrinogen oxidase